MGNTKTKIEYDIHQPWLTLDQWQKDYIAAEGNCFLLCGRQSGKTTAMSIKFGERAVNKQKSIIMMIALTEKQAYNLFFKTLMYLQAKHPKMIKKGRWKPTKHVIYLTNGSMIMCYAAGLTGDGLRTFTLTDLVIDEAAPMAREIFIATMPMLSVTGGVVDMASTPRGKEGYFYQCSKKDTYTKFYISAEDCPRHSKEFLKEEQESMSKLEYAQEYLALFLDDLRRLFPDHLINKCMTAKRRKIVIPGRRYYLGVDIARMGKDESTFEIIDRTDRDHLIHVESIITKRTLTTETTKLILQLENKYHFKQIFVDDGGMGVGVFDQLLSDNRTKRKTIAINNTSRPLDSNDKQKKRASKEDIFLNLLTLMEQGKISLLDDDELALSLKCVQFEYIRGKGENKLRFFGNYMHIVDGLVRASWCSADKSLTPFIY